MKGFMISMFSLGSFWDFTTSFLGIVGLLGITKVEATIESIVVLVTAVVGSGIILALSLNTEEIWQEYPTTELDKLLRPEYRTEEFYKWLRPFYIVSVFFDAYTSFLGTAQYIILRNSRTSFVTIGIKEAIDHTTLQQQLLLVFLTIAVTISPIMLGKIIKK